MTLAQADQILDGGWFVPPWAMVDQESPDRIGLTWNFQISFMNSLHLFLIFSLSMSIYFFGFCWIKPSQFIEKKIYVKNGFKGANIAFVKSKIWYDFLTMKLSNKAIKNEGENSNRNNINTWVFRENARILRHFPFHLELRMFRQVIITNLVFHKLPTSLCPVSTLV